MIRTAWVWLVGCAATLWYGGRILALSTLGSRRLGCACRDLARRWCRTVLRAADTRVVLEGVEHLGRERAQVLVSNHESWFDVFALAGHLPVDYRFVAKRELASIPVFGPAWVACGHVSLDRQDRARAVDSLSAAGSRIVERGTTLVMFPEGTRSVTGALQPFKKGAFVLAIQAGVPVVPVAILGSRAVMPKGSWRVRPGTVRVRIGEPLAVDGLGHEDRDRLVARARRAVAALRGGEGPTSGPPGRSTPGPRVRDVAGPDENGA